MKKAIFLFALLTLVLAFGRKAEAAELPCDIWTDIEENDIPVSEELELPVTALIEGQPEPQVKEKRVINLYFFGDSIVEGYMNDDLGIADYIIDYSTEDITYNIICDYSAEGAFICNEMHTQVGALLEDLNQHKDEENVIICDGGTNDVLKGCTNDHLNTMIYFMNLAYGIDENVRIIYLEPDYISEAYNTCEIFTIAEQVLPCETYKLNRWISAENIKTDHIHLSEDGYKNIANALSTLINSPDSEDKGN